MTTLTLHVHESLEDSSETEGGTCKPTEEQVVLNVATGGANKHKLGWRFTNVTIPQHAVIQKVNLQIWVPTGTAEGNRAMHGNMAFALEDNAAVFSEAAKNLVRTAGSTAVQWDGTLTAAAYNEAPDLGAGSSSMHLALQEVVNRPGWASGNAICLLMTASELCKVTVEMWDKVKNETHSAILTVEWEGRTLGMIV